MTEAAQKLTSLNLVHSVNSDPELIRSNVKSAVARSHHFEDFFTKNRSCVIFGGGPSLNDALGPRSASMMIPAEAEVWCLNNSWRWVAATYGKPNVVVMMDARPENAEFVDEDNTCPHTEWLIASQCHPDVFNALDATRRDVTMWHCAGSEAIKDLGPKRAIGGGGTVLSRAINLAYDRGFRDFTLVGVDSSYRDGEHHAYPQPLNDDANVVEVWTESKTGPFYTTGAMAGQAKTVFRQMIMLERDAFCTFELLGDGLLPTMWRERKEAMANPDKWEPAKYRNMWKRPEYRRFSPAEAKAEAIADALHEANAFADDILDFGTGTGRGAKALMINNGYRVTAIDFASNCLDDGVELPLVIANLWDLPKGIKGDAGTCIDVMEHIPPEKVDAVLANIAQAVPICVFNISFQPDSMGKLINEKLHLTVKPPEWWQNKLSEHFETVTYDKATGLFVGRNSIGD